MTWRRFSSIVSVGVLVAARVGAQPPLCGPNDDPCVVSQDLTFGIARFDLGTRALVVSAGRTITSQILELSAGSFTLEADAKIILVDGFMNVDARGDVRLEPGSLVDASGGFDGHGGQMEFISHEGTIVARGRLRAHGTSRDGDGGGISLLTFGTAPGGDIEIGGEGLQASSGDRATGGGVDLGAARNITVLAPITIRGGEGDGAFLGIEAGGDIVTGPAATIDATTFGEETAGAAVFLEAAGAVSTSGPILLTTPGAGAAGGLLAVEAGEITVGGRVEASAPLRFGAGGEVDLEARGDVRLEAPVIARGGVEGGGGLMFVDTSGSVTMAAPIELGGDTFGDLFVQARGVRVESVVTTSGRDDEGAVSMLACDLDVAAGAVIENLGPLGFTGNTRLSARATMTIGGTLRSRAPAVLGYRDVPPLILPGASITPAPQIVQDPFLMPCDTTCGNGVVDRGEACDDGNVTDSDCCSSSCQFEATGVACEDGSTCTSGDTCDGGRCLGTPLVCDLCERCDEGVGCVAGPKVGCRGIVVPRSSLIDLEDGAPDSKDSLVWKWRHGAATALETFGDPTAEGAYTLCVYDPRGLLLRGQAPGGGLCDGKPCWKAAGEKGFRYRDADASADGLQKMELLAGAEGKASIVVKGRGALLSMPPLGGVAPPVTVQLQASTGQCWQSTHSTPSVNGAARFKARSD